ncbi:MAG: M23 family metallopeptidase [Anaerolineaceae bacterium]|jgi:murein DD-endopeptidase MepM/ murein hydrolase activator NlpD|nr:M23 family metallopeptidase [Anaerolineaceae bacterium]
MKKNFFISLWLLTFIAMLLVFLMARKGFPDSLDLQTKLNPIENVLIGNQTQLTTSDLMANPNKSSQDITSLEEPFSLVLPKPDEAPVSLWRPPLYPTPWAISPHDHFYFSRPIAADEINWPLANYRYGYFFPDSDIIHTGIDITAKRGTPVIAAAPGTVIWAGYGLYYGSYNEEDPYGIAVAIEHDFGYKDKNLVTVYGHMDRVDVEKGQRVETGTQLGIVGNTGFTTGPHLHFEVRYETNSYYRTRNPELWLSPPQGWGVLAGQIKTFDDYYILLQEVYIRSKETNQSWMVLTYATNNINRDEYYKENLALSDLPAGEYTISFAIDGITYKHDFTIYPGAITFFSFREKIGFSFKTPTIQTPEDWENVVLSDDFLP